MKFEIRNSKFEIWFLFSSFSSSLVKNWVCLYLHNMICPHMFMLYFLGRKYFISKKWLNLLTHFYLFPAIHCSYLTRIFPTWFLTKAAITILMWRLLFNRKENVRLKQLLLAPFLLLRYLQLKCSFHFKIYTLVAYYNWQILRDIAQVILLNKRSSSGVFHISVFQRDSLISSFN